MQAQAAEEEDDLEKAASFYQQYVAYMPDDAEEGAHMALLMADIAEQPGTSNMKKRAAFDALEATAQAHRTRQRPPPAGQLHDPDAPLRGCHGAYPDTA